MTGPTVFLATADGERLEVDGMGIDDAMRLLGELAADMHAIEAALGVAFVVSVAIIVAPTAPAGDA